MANLMLFSGGAHPELGQRIAHKLGLQLGRMDIGRFSDGEVTVEVHENVRGRDVFLVQSTCAPTNDSLMELLLMAGCHGIAHQHSGSPRSYLITVMPVRIADPVRHVLRSARRWWRT